MGSVPCIRKLRAYLHAGFCGFCIEMKRFSETTAVAKLSEIRKEFTERIRSEYESRAESCASCETPGACCLDAHFVNVRITRLEAVAIRNASQNLRQEQREVVFPRIARSAQLMNGQSSEKFACPLFEKGIGCLVHETAKPLPCIAHACYAAREDIPPDELLAEAEIKVDKLNQRVYGRTTLLPIPLAITRIIPSRSASE